MDAEGLKELFAPFGAVTVKRMFGGHGIYADGLMFAAEMDGEVYLKADSDAEAVFAAAGSAPFVYQGRTRPMKMNFWRLIAGAYDDVDELKRWSVLAMEAARRAAQAKASKAKPVEKRPNSAGAKAARRRK